MRRVQYLEDLLNHLENYPDIANKQVKVIVKSEFRGIDEDNQFSPAIWLIPGSGRIKGDVSRRRIRDCKEKALFEIMICCVVRDVCGVQRNNIDSSRTGQMYSMNVVNDLRGAFVEGSDLEDCVLKAIEDFNKATELLNCGQNQANPFKYSGLTLMDLPRSEAHNGHLIMPMVFEIELNF